MGFEVWLAAKQRQQHQDWLNEDGVAGQAETQTSSSSRSSESLKAMNFLTLV
jgi:hypothetical protein